MKLGLSLADLPIVRMLRERDAFAAIASIPLANWTELDAATSWAESRWTTASRKYRRKVKAGDRLAYFEFETDDDTVEFLMRFGASSSM